MYSTNDNNNNYYVVQFKKWLNYLLMSISVHNNLFFLAGNGIVGILKLFIEFYRHTCMCLILTVTLTLKKKTLALIEKYFLG